MLFGHHVATERPYPGCSYVARIDFDYGPHQFKSGDAFDWRAIGLVESQATDLWIGGRLLVGKPAVAPPVVAPSPAKKGGR